MTDLHNVESLVLEHLRHIRARVDQIADDVGDLKLRLSSVENGISNGPVAVDNRPCFPASGQPMDNGQRERG